MTGNWERDLSLDLGRLRDEYTTSLLVSLIEDHEFESLQIRELRDRAGDFGIRVLWSPIRDVSVPKSIPEFASTVQTMVDALRAGQTVVVHCMGGLGRTGLAAACAIIAANELTPKKRSRLCDVREQGQYRHAGRRSLSNSLQLLYKEAQ
jgi:protein-tyrosine phosphatase